MTHGVYWARGMREKNEDSIALESVYTDHGEIVFMLVADGIASLDYGEIASGYVAECFIKWFYRYGVRVVGINRNLIERTLGRTAIDCHNELKRVAVSKGIRLGSTCTLICIWGKRYVCLHIGDTACFKHGKKGMTRLTNPHRDENGHLRKCICSMNYYTPDITWGRIEKNEGLIIASDGFMERISRSELEQMLDLSGDISKERIERRLSKIGKECERRGGKDNRSAVWVHR